MPKFFLATFNISNTVVQNILKKMNEINIVAADKRGRHPPGVKLPNDSRKYVVDHINSFKRVPSHYTRKDSSKDYLPGDLSLTNMYIMYLEKCNLHGFRPEKVGFIGMCLIRNSTLHSISLVRIIVTCYIYKNLPDDAKIIKQEKHNKHLKSKANARQFKDIFKNQFIANESHFCEFDFEAVCYCPQIKTKAIFYKSCLAVYNLTIYNIASRMAQNFVWHEAVASRGACEVASCLYKYKNKENGKSFAFMSDTCSGQNRNSIVWTMFLYAVEILDIPKIDQLFFEPRYSQMECDTVHAHIEKASKSVN